MRIGEIFRQKMSSGVKDGVTTKQSAFVVTYRGLSAAKMNILRKDLKRKNADMVVSKTSIARIALKESNYENLATGLQGQMALVLSDADASEVSKVLVKFAKDFEGFTVEGGILNGAVLSGNEVKQFSDLPSREVLLAQFIGTLQAPVTRFAAALNAKTRDFASILKQKSEQGGN
jgi:large subunit ribosomal protein L10